MKCIETSKNSYTTTILVEIIYFIEKVGNYYHVYQMDFSEIENSFETLAEAKQYIKDMEVNT